MRWDDNNAKALLLEGEDEIHQFIEAAVSCRPRRAASNAWNVTGPTLEACGIDRSSRAQIIIYYCGPLTGKSGPFGWLGKRFVQIRDEGRPAGGGRWFPVGPRWQDWLAHALPRMEPVWSSPLVWVDAALSPDTLTARLREAGYRPLTLILVDEPPTTSWECRFPIHVELPIRVSIDETTAAATAQAAQRVAQLKERMAGLRIGAWGNTKLEVRASAVKVTATSSFTVYCWHDYDYQDLQRSDVDSYLKNAGLSGYSLVQFRRLPAIVVLKEKPKDLLALQWALLAGDSGRDTHTP
jgi:hypothetical protein